MNKTNYLINKVYNLQYLYKLDNLQNKNLKIVNFKINNPELYYRLPKYNARIFCPRSWDYLNTTILKDIKNYTLFAISISYLVELIYTIDLKNLKLLKHNSKYISNKTTVYILNDLPLTLKNIIAILKFVDLKYPLLDVENYFLKQYATAQI